MWGADFVAPQSSLFNVGLSTQRKRQWRKYVFSLQVAPAFMLRQQGGHNAGAA